MSLFSSLLSSLYLVTRVHLHSSRCRRKNIRCTHNTSLLLVFSALLIAVLYSDFAKAEEICPQSEETICTEGYLTWDMIGGLFTGYPTLEDLIDAWNNFQYDIFNKAKFGTLKEVVSYEPNPLFLIRNEEPVFYILNVHLLYKDTHYNGEVSYQDGGIKPLLGAYSTFHCPENYFPTH